MIYEELITKILGEHTEREGEVASLVLDFVSKNPNWECAEGQRFKEKAVDCLDKALIAYYGHPLEYYCNGSRLREYVEVRQLSWLIFRESTDYSLHDIARIFDKDHATILYGVRQAKALISTNRHVREDYNNLKQKFIELL